MKAILMQHMANCLVTHSFPCSIFNNYSQFPGTQPRIFSSFVKYIPFFSSTEFLLFGFLGSFFMDPVNLNLLTIYSTVNVFY